MKITRETQITKELLQAFMRRYYNKALAFFIRPIKIDRITMDHIVIFTPEHPAYLCVEPWNPRGHDWFERATMDWQEFYDKHRDEHTIYDADNNLDDEATDRRTFSAWIWSWLTNEGRIEPRLPEESSSV